MNREFPNILYTMSGDVSIAYQVWGKGSIDIVMVPPMINHLEHQLELEEYVQFMRRLSSFSRVITFDKRGQGMSSYQGSTENNLETRMDDIRAVMDAAHSDKAVIFGISESGPMSIMFATTYPESIIALVLCGTFAKLAKTEEYPNAPVDPYIIDSMMPILLGKWGTGIMCDSQAPELGQNPEKLEWYAKLERLAYTPAGFEKMWGLNMRINVYPLLDVISVPTLILHKKDDSAIPIASGYDLHENIAGSTFVELEGHNHLQYLDDSAKLISEIEDFLTEQKWTAPIIERTLVMERILSTVLFTDIVNSTIMATELGDQKWNELLDVHDRISKERIKYHRGRYIRTTGDGLLAMFDGPARAIMCAKSISRELLNAGIKIRSGLHTGEIEKRGQDIGGISVHIASRIESMADPGEILVSRTVKDLVAGSGIEFKEKGIFELKGIPDSWRLFSVG